MAERSLQEQIRTCRQRFEAAPQSRAFAPLADLLRRDGRHAEALTLLEDGLLRHPGFHGAMVILGHTLLDAGRSDHARRVLRTVLEHDPENLVALRLLAAEAGGREDWGAVVPLLERLLAVEPETDAWQTALAEARGHLAAAATEARTAVAAAGPDRQVAEASLATMTLVDIYLAQGYRSRALAALQQMLERDPDRQDVRERIAAFGPVTEDAGPSAQPGDASAGRQLRAVRRAREKQSFADWIDRLHGDEEGTAP